MDTKRSFFEKITGTKSFDENPQESQPSFNPQPQSAQHNFTVNQRPQTQVQVHAQPQQTMQRESFMQQEAPKQEVRASIQERKESRNKMVESEGQLVLDVYQTEREIVIKSTLAGVRPDDIDITITNDMLTIKGLREKDEEVEASDYYYQECYWGPFSRSVILPTEVEADQIKAGLKNGILTIRLPKSEKIKTKKISVVLE